MMNKLAGWSQREALLSKWLTEVSWCANIERDKAARNGFDIDHPKSSRLGCHDRRGGSSRK